MPNELLFSRQQAIEFHRAGVTVEPSAKHTVPGIGGSTSSGAGTKPGCTGCSAQHGTGGTSAGGATGSPDAREEPLVKVAHVTRVQVMAAQLLVKRAAAAGKPVRPAVLTIANAKKRRR